MSCSFIAVDPYWSDLRAALSGLDGQLIDRLHTYDRCFHDRPLADPFHQCLNFAWELRECDPPSQITLLRQVADETEGDSEELIGQYVSELPDRQGLVLHERQIAYNL